MEIKYVSTICPYCGTGCGVNLVVKDGEVVNSAALQRSVVSRGKLCNRGLNCGVEQYKSRIITPVINGEAADYDKALKELEGLKKYSGNDLAVITSTRLTNEANYCILKLGKEVLNAGIVGTVYSGSAVKGNAKQEDIANAGAALIFGDCMKKLPLTGNNLFNVKDKGGKILFAGQKCYTSVQADEAVFENEDGVLNIPDSFIEVLKNAENPIVVYSANDKYTEEAKKAAESVNAKTAVLYETNNGRGCAEMGFSPVFDAIKENPPKAMLIFAENPELDKDIYEPLIETFNKIEFLAVVACNESSLTNIANVLIPMQLFSEYEGTFTNWEGRVQKVYAAIAAHEGIKTPSEIVADISAGAVKYDDNSAIFADIAKNVPAFSELKYEDASYAEGVFIKEV